MQELSAQCREAQEAIVGSMLIDDSCIGYVLTTVAEEDFLSLPCRTVFKAIKQQFTAGQTVDPVIISSTLSNDGAYRDFIMQLMEITPTAAHVKQYCDILKTNSRILRLQEMGRALSEVSDLEQARELSAKINSLMVAQSGICILTVEDMVKNFYERMAEEKVPEYISTGIRSIDEKSYIEFGDVVGIGAAPSTGKTAFALQWATTAARKYRVGFYSLETSMQKATDRIFAREAEVALGDIKKRLFPEDAWARIANSATKLAALKLDFIHAPGMTAADIMATAVSRRHQLIFVDYLQLVKGNPKLGNRYDIVTNTSMEFHVAAQRNGIAVVLLSQLSRPEKQNGKYVPPDMHSFRESGQIEQDLDLALLMYLKDPENYRSDRVVKIGKNKEGEKGLVELTFDGKTQTFKPSVGGVQAQLRRMAKEAKRKTQEDEAFSQTEFPIVHDAVPF